MKAVVLLTLLVALAAIWPAGAGAQTVVNYEIYCAQAGDTVENIAARFGLSAGEIRSLNRLLEGQALAPGQSLALPVRQSQPGVSGSKETSLRAKPEDGFPRLATVASPKAAITAQPGGRVLFQPPLGAQLIVISQANGHCGVLMVDGTTGWVARDTVVLQDPISPEQLNQLLRAGRSDIVREAFRYWGTPYELGGSLPASVDCSLLVQRVFSACGISLPRTAVAQAEVGTPVNYTQLLPGDRLYFINGQGRISHTGIYAGNGQFIHASSNRGGVAVDSLSSDHYWRRFVGARRS